MRHWWLVILLLVCACAHQPYSASSDGAFSAGGDVVVAGARFPARWTLDESRQRAWLDVSAGEGKEGWMLLDWASARGYTGGDSGCYEFALTAPMPSAAQLRTGRTAPREDEALPNGVAVVRGREMSDVLVVQERDAVVLFEIKEHAARANAQRDRDVSSCRPLAEIRDALVNGRSSPTERADNTEIARNLRYTFHGRLTWAWLSYKGAENWQSASEYTTSVQTCTNAGSDKCKPYWTTGGWLGRYGYHCGDGWGSGGPELVSPQDYCCKLHDAEVWGGKGATNANLCGFAACITCKYYKSLDDWRDKFTGDHYATLVIAGQLGAAIPWFACYPQSSISGFTCN